VKDGIDFGDMNGPAAYGSIPVVPTEGRR